MKAFKSQFWMIALLAAHCSLLAQPKVDVSFTNRGVSEAHNVPADTYTSEKEAKSTSLGDEKLPCSNQPAQKSRSTAYATSTLVKKDDSSVSVSLIANAIAKGGKFERCAACDGQFCSAPSGPQRTEASARSEARANVAYQFGNISAATAPKSFRITLTVLEGSADQARMDFRVRNTGTGRQFALMPDKPFDFTPRPNDQIIVTLGIKASVTALDEAETKEDQPNVKLRLDIVEAPVLEASILEGYILRGTVTKEYKSVGLIAAVSDNGVPLAHCTGTVVGKRTVLTAAHCVSSDRIRALLENKRLLFMVGSRAADMTPVLISSYVYPNGEEPEKFRFNRRHDRSLEDDVAILVTETPIGLPAIPLYNGTPSMDSLLASKTPMRFVGFGFDPESGNESGSGIKRNALIPIVSADNQTFFYASANGSSTCNGDSGGPAFIDENGRLQLAGITSYGSSDCSQGRSMRVDRYINWINRLIN